MWWIYLVGAGMMLLMALGSLMGYIFNPELPTDTPFFIGIIAGIWLLNSARVAYREDHEQKEK